MELLIAEIPVKAALPDKCGAFSRRTGNPEPGEDFTAVGLKHCR